MIDENVIFVLGCLLKRIQRELKICIENSKLNCYNLCYNFVNKRGAKWV